MSDGAAAVLLTRRSLAEKLGLPILGKFGGSAVAGVEPKLMVCLSFFSLFLDLS